MLIISVLSSHWKSKIRDWARATKQNINNQPTWLNKLITFLASWERPTETTSKANSKTIIMHFYIQGKKKITVKITPNGNSNAYFRFLEKIGQKKHRENTVIAFWICEQNMYIYVCSRNFWKEPTTTAITRGTDSKKNGRFWKCDAMRCNIYEIAHFKFRSLCVIRIKSTPNSQCIPSRFNLFLYAFVWIIQCVLIWFWVCTDDDGKHAHTIFQHIMTFFLLSSGKR